MSSRKKTENLTFEESMQELESIVAQMEQGDLPLEQALTQFERGINLTKHSQEKLRQAEQKVQILLEEQNALAPFEQPDTDA